MRSDAERAVGHRLTPNVGNNIIPTLPCRATPQRGRNANGVVKNHPLAALPGISPVARARSNRCRYMRPTFTVPVARRAGPRSDPLSHDPGTRIGPPAAHLVKLFTRQLSSVSFDAARPSSRAVPDRQIDDRSAGTPAGRSSRPPRIAPPRCGAVLVHGASSADVGFRTDVGCGRSEEVAWSDSR